MAPLLSGLRAWSWQRLSAVWLALYIVWAIVALAGISGHAELRYLLASPVVLGATGLFFLLLLVHAWVGMRDVILDYIWPLAPRAILLALLGAYLAGCGVWAITILVRAST